MTENPWIPLLELTGTFRVDDLPELNIEQLLDRANKAKNDAEKELAHGNTISEILASEDESEESKKNLATIGIWHFECAVELFEKAIRNFERTKYRGVNEERRDEIESQIKLCQKNIVAVVSQKKSASDSLSSIKL